MINNCEALSNQDFTWLEITDRDVLESLPCPSLRDVALIHSLLVLSGEQGETHVAQLLGDHQGLPSELWRAVNSGRLAA